MAGTGKRTSCSVALAAFALVIVASGCKKFAEALGPPPFGTRVVRTVTGGVNIDPDGYRFDKNGIFPQDIGVNDTVTKTIAIGDYTIRLFEIAANCSVDENPQVATVLENETVTVTFNVTCS